MDAEIVTTEIRAPLYGQVRKFQLRIGEIGELERSCRAGIGAIVQRLLRHEFYAADVWETIRLGMMGGGTSEVDATAIVMALQSQPLADYVGLAAGIISACVNGAKPDPKVEGESDAPATSPPSTPPAPPSASTREPSTASPSPSSTRRSRDTIAPTARSRTKRRRKRNT